MKGFGRAIVALLLLGGTAASAAEPAWEPPASLRQAAERLAREQMAAPGESLHVAAAIDDQLRLPACAAPVAARVHQQAGSSLTAALSCGAPSPWTVYVVVQLSRQAEVLVLSRPVLAGETLTADAVARRTREVAELPHGFLTRPEAAVGQTARRALPAGAVLGPADVAPPRLVREPAAALEALNGLDDEDFEGLASADVLRMARALGENGAEGLPKLLAERLSEQERAVVARAAKAPAAVAPAADCAQTLRKLGCARRHAEVEEQIARLGGEGGGELDRLLQLRNALARQLNELNG